MNRIKELVFGLKWEHKNEDIRATAVAQLNDPRLIGKLSEIATSDPVAKVRLHAIRRITDLPLLLNSATKDTDLHVNAQAWKSIKALISGSQKSTYSNEQCAEFVNSVNHKETIDSLAVKAHSPLVRLQAVQKITQQGLLGDITLNDKAIEVRLQALNQIKQSSTLERIAKKSRTSDKRIYKAVTALLDAIKIEAGNEDTLALQADAICNQVQSLISEKEGSGRRAELDQLDEKWKLISAKVSQELIVRYENSTAILRRALIAPQLDAENKLNQTQQHDSTCTAILNSLDLIKTQASVDNDLNALQKGINQAEQLWQKLDQSLLTPRTEQHYSVARELALSAYDSMLEALPLSPKLIEIHQKAKHLLNNLDKKLKQNTINRFEKDWQRAYKESQSSPKLTLLSSQFNEIIAGLNDELNNQQKTATLKISRAKTLLDLLEPTLENADLKESKKLHNELADIQRQLAHHSLFRAEKLDSAINTSWSRMKELRDWQHWANEKVRKDICDDIESLIGQQRHPDAVLEKVRSAQKQWRELDQMEHLPGDRNKYSASREIKQQFTKACDLLIKPARPYLQKREDLQHEKYQSIGELLELAELQLKKELPWDWKSVRELSRNCRRAMRDLNEIPAKNRSTVASKIRETLDLLDIQTNSHYESVIVKKEFIIAQASALETHSPLADAISKAKGLQSKWKNAGTADRKSDQKLWKIFRTHVDAVFAKQAEEKQQEIDVQNKLQSHLVQLCEEVENHLSLKGDALRAVSSQIAGAKAAWQEHEGNNTTLNSRFEKANKAYQLAIVELNEDDRREQRNRLKKAAEIIWEFDDNNHLDSNVADNLKQEFEKLLSHFDTSQSKQLLNRFDLDRSSEITVETNNAANELCIQLEILAGIESPKEAQQARMNFQISKLNESFNSNNDASEMSKESRFLNLVNSWYLLAPLPSQQRKTYQIRVDSAMNSTFK